MALDDLDKFFNDNLKVWMNMKFIEKLSNVLNELHGLDWNIKVWKILVGPLGGIYIICENETISSLYSSYVDIDHHFRFTSKNFDDFSKSYHDNNFNNIIYSYILKKLIQKNKL